MEFSRWQKLFSAFWRVLGNTETRNLLRVDRPVKEIVAKFNGKCSREGCLHVFRMNEKICYLPSHNNAKAEAYHWACAPAWTVDTSPKPVR